MSCNANNYSCVGQNEHHIFGKHWQKQLYGRNTVVRPKHTTWMIFCSTRPRCTWVVSDRSMTGWVIRLYCLVSNNSVNKESSSGFPCTPIHAKTTILSGQSADPRFEPCLIPTQTEQGFLLPGVQFFDDLRLWLFIHVFVLVRSCVIDQLCMQREEFVDSNPRVRTNFRT